MHPVLEIQEILLNIFSHCYDPPEEPRDASWLAALARTCHAFKDPALDVLWEKLYSFSPLFRCLPGAFREKEGKYSFIRPLTETEWDILRSYTRRIRSLEDVSITFEDKTFLNPPTNDPLFPRLRSLCCKYETDTILLSQLHIPSLSTLDLCVDTLLLQDNLQSLPTHSPNISTLSITLNRWQDELGCEIEPNYFPQWKNLDTLICDRVHLDMDCIVHLSRVPTLTRLSFILMNRFPASYPILRFENLQELSLRCDCSAPLSSLLSRTEFLAITDLSLVIPEFEEALGSFFSQVQTANPTHTIETLSLSVLNETADVTFHALRPCMAFHHLRSLRIDTVAEVQLTDNDLLTLASAWPSLQKLSLNRSWGWFTADGITPIGLLQLLQICQDLSDLTLPIDTRGEIPKLPEDFGSTLPDAFTINVLDSKIGIEVVPAMRGFFAGFASSCNFSLIAWFSWRMLRDDECEVHTKRWNDVYPLDEDAEVDVN